MLSTKTKPKPAEHAVPDFEAAKARWAEIDVKRRKLLEQSDGIRLAQNYARSGVDKRVPEAIRAKADPYLKLAKRSPQKMAQQLEDVLYAIEDFDPKFQVERDLYQAACQRETSRVALDLQPRHRAAVKEIVKAIEALSRAMTDEIETRAELARTAPDTSSAYLPNCVAGLTIGTLADWNSQASEWARRMRRIGVLE